MILSDVTEMLMQEATTVNSKHVMDTGVVRVE